MPPAIRSRSSARLRRNARRGGSRRLRVAAFALRSRLPPASPAPTRSPSSRRNCGPTRTPMCSTPSSSSRSTRRSRKRSQKGVPLYFVLEFELMRPRWYWVDEKVLSLSHPVPRLVQRAHAAISRRQRAPRARRSTRWTKSSASFPASRRGRSRRARPARRRARATRRRSGCASTSTAAEAVPAERARLARMDAAIGVASLELHAMSGPSVPPRVGTVSGSLARDALAAAGPRVSRRDLAVPARDGVGEHRALRAPLSTCCSSSTARSSCC